LSNIAYFGSSTFDVIARFMRATHFAFAKKIGLPGQAGQ
jgi:hypothetical protein